MSDIDKRMFLVEGSIASTAKRVNLGDAGFRERSDLEEWVIEHPEVLGPDVMIITSEFDRWRNESGTMTRDRLDVLGLDSSGQLVVVELKLKADRGVHLQAITYAALVAGFSEETLVQVLSEHRNHRGHPTSHAQAQELILEHTDEALDPDVLAIPRIVLMAESYPDQVITSAVWLTKQGLDISLHRVSAFDVGPSAHPAKSGRQVAVLFERTYPVEGVDDLLLEPARRESAQAAAKAAESTRSKSAVKLIVENQLIEEGTRLDLVVTNEVSQSIRHDIEEWVNEEPGRGQGAWIDHKSRPIRWVVDGEQYAPTTLVKKIHLAATGKSRESVRGPHWWQGEDGQNLADIAGMTDRTDWSTLHSLIDQITPGEWTSYGELANVVGIPAQPLGSHIANCSECPHGAHRVLTQQGKPAAGFRWTNSDETKSCQEVLADEGVRFDVQDHASRDGFVKGEELQNRISSAT